MAESKIYSPSVFFGYMGGITVAYTILSIIFYYDKILGFSPRSKRADGRPQFSSAHRHAAYKFIIVPTVEAFPMFLAFKEFNFSVSNVASYFWRVVSDPQFAAQEVAAPLGPSSIWMGNCFAIAFFLGGFHYYTNVPYKGDRVLHKVLASSFSFLGTLHGTGNRMVLITTLLWKPGGFLESTASLLHLSSLHKTPFAKAYIFVMAIITSLTRFAFELPWFYGCVRGVWPAMVAPEGPDVLLGVCGLLIGGLTVLHLKWAWEATTSVLGMAKGREPVKAKVKLDKKVK